MKPMLFCALGACLVPVSVACADTDDFESYAPGVFPSLFWLDVGLVDPTPPNPPDPSAVVIETTDAGGNPTLALGIPEALAESQGVFRAVGSETRFRVRADVRVDQFADQPEFETSDWAIQVGAGVYDGVDFCCTPQVGVYASALTQGWRLYGYGIVSGFGDIDLGLPVDLGRWYTIDVDIDTVTGVVGTRILDAQTGGVLVDRRDALSDWVPEDGPFSVVGAFDGELSKGNTVGNVAAVDNFEYDLGAPSVGCAADCNGDGALNILDFVCFQVLFQAGCP